ncbi:helix-turn-helix domain-containing protein [Flavobacterium sp.]|uniref:helix-turn-helix domain-containing protein n=1 Tax=Flavobacterium sp. TaxID=239 RepID=UPI0037501C2B
MVLEIITGEELNEFRELLLKDLKEFFTSKSNEQKKWLKSKDVRKLLNISPGTLQNLRTSNTLKSNKIGGTIFYAFNDIEKMLTEKNKTQKHDKSYNR